MPVLLPRLNALTDSSTLSLSAVTRTDSAGLAYLMELTRRGRARGVELKFTDAPAQVVQLAHFFGLEPVLKFES
jgi:ABC-type transporter Mla MlaB component